MQKQKLEISRSKNLKRLQEREKIYYRSKFNFLMQHNGIRPNKMHLFIAPTHIGKSTLTHAVVNDLINKNSDMRILLYLTEETVSDFETAISGFVSNFDEINKRLSIMIEDKNKSDEEIKEAIETCIIHGRFDLFVMDNITTSKLYMDRKVDIQSTVSIWLKGLLEDTSLYIIAHTNGNNYNTEMLDETHIRGSKTITNITEFLYVMQPVRTGEHLRQFIRIIKHRGQSPDNKFFKIVYNGMQKTITEDIPVDFNHFKEIFKLRNKL